MLTPPSSSSNMKGWMLFPPTSSQLYKIFQSLGMDSTTREFESQQQNRNITFFNVFSPSDASINCNLFDEQPSSSANNGSIYSDSIFKTDRNMRPCVQCVASHKKVSTSLEVHDIWSLNNRHDMTRISVRDEGRIYDMCSLSEEQLFMYPQS